MNNIFKAILSLAASVLVVASCTNTEELTTTISVDKTDIAFATTDADVATVNVTAAGDWYAYVPEWLKAEPSHGSGNTEVKLTAADNVDQYSEANAPRADVVVFWGADEARANVSVSQSGESGLDASKEYKLITKAEEFDATKGIVVAANVNGTYMAVQPWKGAAETNYSYLFGTAITPDADGVFTYANGSLAWTFEATGTAGEYLIKQSNGYYLFQSASYNNFYTTTDAAKADVWTVTFQEAGTVMVHNKTCDKDFVWDKGYSNYGAYTPGDSKYPAESIVPNFFQDQAAPTGEVLSVNEENSVTAKTTSITIPVTSNKTWKVRNHDSWIKTFTTSGTGNGNIEITFDENTSKTDSKTATFTLIGETTYTTFTLEQGAISTTVAGVVAQIVSADKNAPSSVYAELEGAVVSYVNNGNIYIEDASGAVLLYSKATDVAVGDKITGVIEGSGYIYNKLPELTTIGTKFTKEAGATVPVTEMTIADLLKSYNANLSRRIKIVGVEVTAGLGGDDRDGTIKQGEKDIALRAQAKGYAALSEGTKGDVIVFPSLYNNNKQLSYYEGMFTATYTVGAINASDVTVTVGGTATIKATPNVEGVTLSYTSSDTATATVDDKGVVTGVKVGEATITISFAAGEKYSAGSKTIKVTVESNPSYTITDENLPTSYPADDGTTYTLNGVSCYLYNVANFGSGIQMKKGGSYIANAAAIGSKICSVVITWQKNFYPENLTYTFGTSAKPETAVAYTSSDTEAMTVTFDLSSQSYQFFEIKNASTYASYLKSIYIEYAK
ncbi:MAG: hypothetical protein K6F21_05570 [Bacteroidales bacterium]|nr:hypothetical protein [Bacteroidales bacterium]